MSNLEKWIRAILNEDADNLSLGSVRTLQMIKHEFERLQKEIEKLEKKITELQAEKEKLMSDYMEQQTLCQNNEFKKEVQ